MPELPHAPSGSQFLWEVDCVGQPCRASATFPCIGLRRPPFTLCDFARVAAGRLFRNPTAKVCDTPED